MLIRAIAKAEGETIIKKLANILEDENTPTVIIEQVLKYLSAAQWAKFKLTEPFEAKLASQSPDGKLPPLDTKTPRKRRKRQPKEYPNPPYIGEPHYVK